MLTGKGKVIFRYRADQKVLEASANRRTSLAVLGLTTADAIDIAQQFNATATNKTAKTAYLQLYQSSQKLLTGSQLAPELQQNLSRDIFNHVVINETHYEESCNVKSVTSTKTRQCFLGH